MSSRATRVRRAVLILTAVASAHWPRHAFGSAPAPRPPMAALPSMRAMPRVEMHPRADAGRIAGTVVISSALTARRPRFRIYADAGPGSVPPPPPRSDIPSELRNVVVYVAASGHDGAALAAAPSPAMPDDRLESLRHGSMAQLQERFEPHVLALMQGGRVDFPNNDDVYHNVFSLSRTRTFDLGRYPTGSSKSVTFNTPGVVQVFCHIHSDMSGIVFVTPNAHFARPDTAGAYAIENVPPGDYTIVGWHERTKPVSQKIRVVAGQTARMDFNLPLERAPEQ